MASKFNSRYQLLFLLSFLLLEGIFISISILSYGPQHIRVLVLLYLLSFLPFVLSLYIGPSIKLSFKVVFITAVVFRLTLLASFPGFSDDVFRYLWEGKMQLEGINPYLVAPDDPVTAPFRDSYWQLINHKDVPTIYPPLSELFFRICMGIAYNLYFFKAVLISLDLGVLVFLHFIIRKRSIHLRSLLIYAWHPLVIIEIAGSGHQDILGIFFLVGCLLFWQYQRFWQSAMMLTGAVLSKLFPLFLFPLLLRNKSKWPYLILIFFTVLFYMPFYSPDDHLFTGLTVYSETWQANDSVFYIIHSLMKNMFASKVAIGILFLIIYVFAFFKIPDFGSACFMALGGFLILSPTFHPWYILWIIPLLVITFNKAWFWLTMGIVVYYHVLIDYFDKGIWQEQMWIKITIFLPFFILLAISFIFKPPPSRDPFGKRHKDAKI